MYRRQVLATSAAVVTFAGGCLGSGGDGGTGTSGNDEDPFETDPGSLLLTAEKVESVTGDGWEVGGSLAGGSLTYNGADAVELILPSGDEATRSYERVLNGAWLEETVEAARESYESHPNYDSYYVENGAADVSIGVESIARPSGDSEDADSTIVLFRDANAIGAVTYINSEMSAEERTDDCVDMAAEMHATWRE